MKPVSFVYRLPRQISGALAEIGDQSDESKVIAGGQSLGPMLNLRLARPNRLVDISEIPEIRQCRENDDTVEIGAAITHAEIEDGKVPDPAGGLLRHVAAGIAYRAVRNRGTIGGSLCHADPAADWVSAMAVLDAELVLQRGRKKPRAVSICDFMLGAYTTVLEAGEMLHTVTIPKYSGEVRWGYYKICRKVGEFADAIGAVLIDPEKRYCRVVCGATGGAPLILEATSLDLARHAEPQDLERIKEELRSSVSASSEVKLHQLAVAVARSIEQALQNA